MGQLKRFQSANLDTHIGSVDIWTQPVPRAKTSVDSEIGMVLVHLLYQVFLETKELRLQAAQQHYSTLLVLLLQKGIQCSDSRRTQFYYDVFWYSQRERYRKRLMLDLGSIAITQTQAVGFTTYRRVIIQSTCKWSIHSISGTVTEILHGAGDPPEGTYLHIFGGAYTDLKGSYIRHSVYQGSYAFVWGTQIIQTSITHLIMVSTETSVSRQDLHSLPGGGTDGELLRITTAVYVPTRYPGGQNHFSMEKVGTDSRSHHNRWSFDLQNKRTYQYSRCYLHSGYWYCWKWCWRPRRERRSRWSRIWCNMERFTPATEYGMSDLLCSTLRVVPNVGTNPMSYGYYGDDKDPGASGQITIRQEGGIYTLKRRSPRIYETVADGTGAYTYEWWCNRRGKNILRSWMVDLYIPIGGASENCCSCRTRCWNFHIQWRRQKRAFYCTGIWFLEVSGSYSTYTFWYSKGTTSDSSTDFKGSGTLTLSNRHRSCYWNSDYTAELDLVLSLDLVLVQRQFHSKDLLQVLFLHDISGEADTRWFASLPRLHYIWYLFTISGELSHIHLSTYTPAEHWWWKSQHIFGIGEEKAATTPRVGSGVGTFTASGTCNRPRFASQTIWRRNNSLTISKGASAISRSSHSSLRILRRRQRSRHIWCYYTFWSWRLPETNSDIRILRRRQRSWHIGNIYILQYSSCTSICRLYAFNWYWKLQFSSRHLEQLSNLSRKAITRLKEDSKDLQVLKNPSVEQLMLVLVKLIPLELLKQSILLSRKEELTLS